MPIDVKDIYDQAFEAHRHASDYRVKIVGGWFAMYTAFAGVFVWVHTNAAALIPAVVLATAVMTLVMWLADIRNRPAIGRAKSIGEHIEKDPTLAIPPDRHFFSKLGTGVPHGWLINGFALASFAMLVGIFLAWIRPLID